MVFGLGVLLVAGCQLYVDDADREVFRLVEQRQTAALGDTQNATIDREKVPIAVDADAYSFTPSPITPDVPEAFRQTTTQPADLDDYDISGTADAPMTQPVEMIEEGQAPEKAVGETQPATTEESPIVMTLAEALLYAQENSREIQTAKENLYLSALDLSLERFLWTPQFVSTISTEYANYGEIRQFDHAMQAVADLAVEQRLPYGGEVTARVISTLMRDLNHRVTTGETAQLILEANIPLLRGAGEVAYESRYQAERDLIYATREFESFRRDFAVAIASDYFRLLALKQNVVNSEAALRDLHQLWLRAKAQADEERLLELEESRAKNDERQGQTKMIDDAEAYGTALDQFKIRLGMSTTTNLEITMENSGGDLEAPTISEEDAIEAALQYRLDLLTTRDQIEDARRGVKNSGNNLLPDLNFSAQMTSQSNPTKYRPIGPDYDRTTWRTFLDLEVPLNRQAERNQYRRSLIFLRRSERLFSRLEDTVRSDVRRALRRILQRSLSLQIQDLTIVENERRYESAKIRFEQGLIQNRDILEAIDDIRAAKDTRAQALAQYRQSILEFQRDTGTLRIGETGKWLEIQDPSR
jgi:outer membrane protein TolC